MMRQKNFVNFLYTNQIGKFALNILLETKVLKLAESFLRSKLSKPLINIYIKKNQIDMSDFKGQSFQSFQEFFARRRANNQTDMTKNHLISPCDGLLSAHPITKESAFTIKGTVYRLCDLVNNADLAKSFEYGACLIFRLRATEYHHFCYIDEGFHYTNHFMPGTLHSVQPIACNMLPVYRLNRRMWTVMDTKNFGKVVQIGVGALLVGDIIYEKSCQTFQRGEEMGHFELAGSTIVLLFQKDQIRLSKRFQKKLKKGGEAYVKMGEMIGKSV